MCEAIWLMWTALLLSLPRKAFIRAAAAREAKTMKSTQVTSQKLLSSTPNCLAARSRKTCRRPSVGGVTLQRQTHARSFSGRKKKFSALARLRTLWFSRGPLRSLAWPPLQPPAVPLQCHSETRKAVSPRWPSTIYTHAQAS
eukprot:5776910-Pleurochrysis_carterae.AAC.1